MFESEDDEIINDLEARLILDDLMEMGLVEIVSITDDGEEVFGLTEYGLEQATALINELGFESIEEFKRVVSGEDDLD